MLHLLHFHIRTWSGWEPRYSGVLGSKGSQRMELGGAGFPEPEVRGSGLVFGLSAKRVS